MFVGRYQQSFRVHNVEEFFSRHFPLAYLHATVGEKNIDTSIKGCQLSRSASLTMFLFSFLLRKTKEKVNVGIDKNFHLSCEYRLRFIARRLQK
jgi:hypothetical protein